MKKIQFNKKKNKLDDKLHSRVGNVFAKSALINSNKEERLLLDKCS